MREVPPDVEDEEASEGLKPKVLRSPSDPSPAEVEEHEALGHSVHRSWCGHCMRSRGLMEKHTKQKEEDKNPSIPTLGIDYYYLGEKEEGLPHLQVRDSHTGMSWASPVPAKGNETFAVNFMLGVLDEVGYKRLILKSDNEPAIKALKDAVKAASQVDVILEESKTGDSQSNGLAEVAVRESKRQCRAMKSALQEHLGVEIGEKHPILSWLARHGNFLISRYRVGQDGKTGYEKLKGKKWRRPVVTFGERVWFRPLKSYMAGKSDLEDKLYTGRYVGTHGRNGDVLIMTKDGVLKGGSIKRMSPAERWDASDFESMIGTPWMLRPKTLEDVDSLPVKLELPAAEGRLTPDVSRGEAVPRSLYVKRKDVEGNYTLGCPGCIAIQTGLPVRSHNAECRTRVEQRLKDTEEGKMRIEHARKRKAEAEIPAEEGMPALEDVPDVSEEMHAPSAIGEPSGVRVEPLVRPAQADKRPAEEGNPKKAEKKARPETPRGVKRASDDVMEKTLGDLYDEEKSKKLAAKAAKKQDTAKASTTSDSVGGPSSSSSSGAAPTAILEIAALLGGNVFRKSENVPTKEIMEISQLLCSVGIHKSDVAEIYNPKRFVSRANAFGLRPGFAVDLTIQKNEKGEFWDLSREKDRRDLKSIQRNEKPLFLIGSPPCGPFSPLQNLSKGKRTQEENDAILAEGRLHLKTACEAYEEQHRNGRFFLHEHPKPASSWQEEPMRRIMELEGVYTIQAPMCKWGMTSEDGEGLGYVRKETQWVTNSPELAKTIEGKCDGSHRHVHLINGRARYAQVYPPKLVSAILRGIKRELRNLGELSMVAEMTGGPAPDGESNEQKGEYFDGKYFDTTTGAPLRTEAVLEARKEELRWIHKQRIYEKVPLEECYEVTGRKPIDLKWIDKNKGDAQRENYRSRLVVREIKAKGQALADHELYSAMPPLEALKVLCSLLTSMKTSPKGRALKLRLLDISRAHFYGESRRAVYCTLPEGDEQTGMCAKLVRTMYGTQDASSVWQETYTTLMNEHGIQNGKAWPAIFWDPVSDARFLVHGDDFLILGDQEAQERVEDILAKKFEFREDGCIGPEEKDGTVMTILNRILEFDKSTGVLRYEADPRHGEAIIKSMGLDGEKVKGVTTPGEKPKPEEAFEESPLLDDEQAKTYRSVVMRAAYLSLDRCDICEAVKTLARYMSSPTELAWTKLKRLARYILSVPRVIQEFRPQKMYNKIRAYGDSDHAGCVRTRKSTTGMVLMAGQHLLKASSTLQTTVSLSSGESEYYAIVKVASNILGLRELYREWNVEVGCMVLSDSSAARGMCSRRGLGKTRHVQTRYLWVQHRLKENEFELVAVGTDKNVSDVCTKPMSHDLCWKHMNSVGQFAVSGKSRAAKGLQA